VVLQLGYDVLLYLLPFHGVRQARAAFSGWGLFAHGPAHLNEAIAHAVHDFRGFVDYLESEGVQQVALTGLSLGGYVSSLLAAVEDCPKPIETWSAFCPRAHAPKSRQRKTKPSAQMTLTDGRRALIDRPIHANGSAQAQRRHRERAGDSAGRSPSDKKSTDGRVHRARSRHRAADGRPRPARRHHRVMWFWTGCLG